ncbi:hypothetical protein CBS101457_001289 [Exobasidium rhododendri]|nr:hypothetical protein CBS101457_001289 [Exobasidium rhododendri]
MKGEDRPDDDMTHDEDGDAERKRKRVTRACDVCRKKKIRCDGLQPEKGACSNCATYGHDCTFADAVKRRAPPRSYVIALEARMEKAEEMIRQLAPYLDLDSIIGPMPVLTSDKKDGEADSPPLNPTLVGLQDGHIQRSRQPSDQAIGEDVDNYELEDDEDAAYLQVSLDNFNLELPKSSATQTTGQGYADSSRADTKATSALNASHFDSGGKDDEFLDAPRQFLGRASEFHILPLLEKMSLNNKATTPLIAAETSGVIAEMICSSPTEDGKDYSSFDFAWPANDLRQTLVDAYFARHNRDIPILNETVSRKLLSKPTWEWKDGRSLLIALGVFCIASRYVEDDRLTGSDGIAMGTHWHKIQMTLLAEDFHQHGTAVMYIQSTLMSITYSSAAPKSTLVHAWVSLSTVVRMLEDCGAHRKFTAERLGWSLLTEETYKRLWWATYVLDRQLSADLGRPMAIQDEDFDLDEILLIDDEYIYQASENHTKPVQPAGKICYLEGFLQTTRLSQVIGRTLRTIYAISKSKISRGFVGRKWDALVVADIDKSLNNWLAGVPSHLRYNPEEQDTDILLQSSRLFVQYYFIQTLIHRPFIQSEKWNKSDLTFKSLAIVSNAARSAIHIMHNLRARGLLIKTNPDLCFRSFSFGCMLLFICWSAYSSNLRVSQSLMGDVRKVLDIFESMQKRFDVAKNMAAVMRVIINRSALPVLESSALLQHSNKRHFDDRTAPFTLPQQQHNQHDDTSIFASTSEQEQTRMEGTQRNIRNLPSSWVSSQLPLSTVELQSAFSSSDSPDSVNLDHTAHSQYPYLSMPSLNQNSTQIPARQNDSGTRMNDGTQDLYSMNREQWPLQQSYLQQQNTTQDRQVPFLSGNPSAPSNVNYNNEIDSTIFDPTNRTLDTFLSGRMPNNSFEMFNNTPGSSSMFSNGGNSSLEGLNSSGEDVMGVTDPQAMNGIGSVDPLDALVNMQSLWSDADWMRAFDQ